MPIELLNSTSTQKAHRTCYKQGSILHYLGTNQRHGFPNNGSGKECRLFHLRAVYSWTSLPLLVFGEAVPAFH